MRHPLVLSSWVLILIGCGEGERSASAVEERDSSGATLLLHSAEPGQLLSTEDSPELVVGTPLDGTELFRVRGGVLLPENAFAIANSGTNEVLFFGPEGELVRRVGGEGEGPEEFKNILWIQNRGGGDVSVYDAGNFRVNRYGPSGEFISSHPVRISSEDPPSGNVMVGQGFHLGGSLFQVICESRPRVAFRPDSLPPYLNHYADSLPAYRAVQVDGDGRIWVQPPATAGHSVVRWRVFSADGRSKSEVDLPASSALLDASGDRLLLLERDSLDIETISVRVVR